MILSTWAMLTRNEFDSQTSMYLLFSSGIQVDEPLPLAGERQDEEPAVEDEEEER